MKHNLKITILLLVMFLVTQLIGIAVLHADVFHLDTVVDGQVVSVPNPYLSWIQLPELETEREFLSVFPQLIIAFDFGYDEHTSLLLKFKIAQATGPQ